MTNVKIVLDKNNIIKTYINNVHKCSTYTQINLFDESLVTTLMSAGSLIELFMAKGTRRNSFAGFREAILQILKLTNTKFLIIDVKQRYYSFVCRSLKDYIVLKKKYINLTTSKMVHVVIENPFFTGECTTKGAAQAYSPFGNCQIDATYFHGEDLIEITDKKLHLCVLSDKELEDRKDDVFIQSASLNGRNVVILNR